MAFDPITHARAIGALPPETADIMRAVLGAEVVGGANVFDPESYRVALGLDDGHDIPHHCEQED